ncbi:MAG: hypothetical protein KKE79_08095 [Actinobacteria bacterium]|nr:hypothetical protein [Actinomycetota bacterium]MBU4241576.1 hypothetical protein [Actinomycetota bacterium]MBU4301556.1 hypothetical protein [Actinomycetota bacterium]MBU4490580.1 hypothetical protein [Actinomycetota bacterium]MCG2796412.1 hypothetical protein [Actinomycetes bacterium]
MIEERLIPEQVRKTAEWVLSSTGICKIEQVVETPRVEPGRKGSAPLMPAFIINVRAAFGEPFSLLFEVKPLGQPRFALIAANSFAALEKSEPASWYGIFAAPYISKKTMQVCRENGIGCMDLAGNCYLQFDGIYIDVQGRPNPYPARRKLKSIFYPKSARVLRALLENPRKEWLVQDLSKEAGVSIGQVSNVKQRLLDYDLVEEAKSQGARGFLLKDPKLLLEEWAKNYTYRKNRIVNYYSPDDTEEIERKITEYCANKGIEYGFTLTSGADLVAPALRYKRVYAYVDTPPDELAEEFGWKEVSSGWNVSLLVPYDHGIFYGRQEAGGRKVVSDTQLYLDLMGYKPRGEEAAEQVLRERLEKKW